MRSVENGFVLVTGTTIIAKQYFYISIQLVVSVIETIIAPLWIKDNGVLPEGT